MSNKPELDRPIPGPDVPPDPSTAVAVAYVHTDEVDYSFFHSYTHLLAHDLINDGKVWRGGPIAMYGGTDGLAHSRNTVVKSFLEDGKADWLWWIDTDMGFSPDTVERLFANADPVERPVVGALCFAAMHADEDGAGGWRDAYMPVILDWVHTDESTGFSTRWDYPRDMLTRCEGTGSACILIHRTVFEKVRDNYGPDWASWYSRLINPATGELVSEDLSFCLRLIQAAIPVWVDTSVQTTHAKRLWLQQEDYWQQRALAPAPAAAPVPVDERAAPRYAIVPTHNRPAQLVALVASLGKQCDYIVVLDNASSPAVYQEQLQVSVPGHVTVEVIRDEEQPPNLSRFWNVMFDRCAELAQERGQDIWDVASFNDDAVAPAGWFDVCSTVLRANEKAVVAHTGTIPVHRDDLLDAYPFERHRRMCPWAFVVRGELGLRSDESMRWFCFDDDFSRQAIDAGGVLSVPGPLVVNTHANQSTVQSPVLIEQAQRDMATFAAKWGSMP